MAFPLLSLLRSSDAAVVRLSGHGRAENRRFSSKILESECFAMSLSMRQRITRFPDYRNARAMDEGSGDANDWWLNAICATPNVVRRRSIGAAAHHCARGRANPADVEHYGRTT